MAGGRAGTHQNQSLRHAEQESREGLSTSPHVSLDQIDSDNQQSRLDIGYDDQDGVMEDLASSGDADNGQYGEEEDGESDDMMDDDMMDKISSSPSIDDGELAF